MSNHTPIKPPQWVLERIDNCLQYNYQNGDLIWINPVSLKIKAGTKAGAITKSGHILVTFRDKEYGRKGVLAHHIVWYIHYGEWPLHIVEHKNGIGIHNYIENLRPATHQQNKMNIHAHRNNQTGHKGVSPHRNKFIACIMINGKTKYLGVFRTIEDASVAYDKAEKLYFGEFASTNGCRDD